MDIEYCIKSLADNSQRIRLLVEQVSLGQARWKPDLDSWSILEVLNHLLDEERLDFRVRLDITLNRSKESWPAIDPPAWVIERNYNERNLQESLIDFMEARKDSIAWLATLKKPDWEADYEAPWGRMRAGDLMAAWAAHDLLHLRQLVELHWAYAEDQVKPFRTLYAGEW